MSQPARRGTAALIGAALVLAGLRRDGQPQPLAVDIVLRRNGAADPDTAEVIPAPAARQRLRAEPRRVV
jgi:hypothetical protein